MLRIHVLRSTWHYVHADDAQWLQELTAPRVMPVFEQQLQPLAARLNSLTDEVEAMLAESPDRTRTELAGALADRGEELTGQQLMLLLGRLEVLGLVCSGAPRDGEHTYALFADRVPDAAAPRPRRGARRDRPALLHLARAGHRARPRVLGHPHRDRRASRDRRGIRSARLVRARRTNVLARARRRPGIRVACRPPAAGARRDVPRLPGLALGAGRRRHRAARARDGDRDGPRRRAARRRDEAHGVSEGGHLRLAAASRPAGSARSRPFRMPRGGTASSSGSKRGWISTATGEAASVKRAGWSP